LQAANMVPPAVDARFPAGYLGKNRSVKGLADAAKNREDDKKAVCPTHIHPWVDSMKATR